MNSPRRLFLTTSIALGLLAPLAATAQLTLLQTGGSFRTDATNLATTGTAFSSSEIGVSPHATGDLNDGTYGNSSSWIGGGINDSAGIIFSSATTLGSFAFGRDNTGVYADRSNGDYNIYYTTSTGLTAANALSATWTSIGLLSYPSATTQPAARNLYNLSSLISGVTGFRIQGPTGAAIDEIELYSTRLPGVTNLRAPGGSISGDSSKYLGQAFTTSAEAQSFLLDKVALGITSGSYSNFTVNLRANGSNNMPGNILATLNGSDDFSGANPSYTASNVILDPLTTYWVTWGFSGEGHYQIGSTTQTGSGGWELGSKYAASFNEGLTWLESSPGNYFNVEITATAIPEPSTYAALAGLGALGLALWRRRQGSTA